MKKLSILIVCCFGGLNLYAGELTSLGKLKITKHLRRTHKSSVVLTNDTGTARVRLDCLDGRMPTNTILDLISKQTEPHETFTGTSDFYCQGLNSILLKDLKENDLVEVFIDFSREKKVIGTDEYEVASIKDIQLRVDENTAVRSFKKNPGTKVKFESMEPVFN